MAMFSSGHDMQLASRLLQGVGFSLMPLSIRGNDAGSAGDDEFSAPGWYDSSWDLRQGLEVREGAPAAGLPREWGELFVHA